MNIREAIDQLKCSPEGQSNPKVVAVLEALAAEAEKPSPAPTAPKAKPKVKVKR